MIELGQMKNKETIKSKAEKLKILKGYEEKPVNDIEQLHKIKEETINRWEKSGLLNGLKPMEGNLAKMLESKDSFIINKENEIFTRIHVIDILNQFAFFLTHNGDPDTTPKKWLDIQYPEE